ncbi:MAG: hypothetical protein C0403_16905, partial [Desulfobacterium sp.]|nr:hypothetical protein [Desulfobacterium sp.]
CVACHEDKSKNWLEKKGLWLHTPAAQGRCVVCHHAHQSTQPFLLLNNREKLCKECHVGKKCAGNESHAQNANQCLVCHNPHAGINKMMLVKEMKEERSKSPIRIELNAQGNDKD